MLFFYPLDFTFVCPTEILAFNDRADEFRKINAEVSRRSRSLQLLTSKEMKDQTMSRQGI